MLGQKTSPKVHKFLHARVSCVCVHSLTGHRMRSVIRRFCAVCSSCSGLSWEWIRRAKSVICLSEVRLLPSRRASAVARGADCSRLTGAGPFQVSSTVYWPRSSWPSTPSTSRRSCPSWMAIPGSTPPARLLKLSCWCHGHCICEMSSSRPPPSAALTRLTLYNNLNAFFLFVPLMIMASEHEMVSYRLTTINRLDHDPTHAACLHSAGRV
jgi:hypothetical protein